MSKYNPMQFERWRQLMLAGAAVLLITSILRAVGVMGGGIVYAIGLAIGYVLLVFGFGDSFRTRRAKQEAAEREKLDPPVNGS